MPSKAENLWSKCDVILHRLKSCFKGRNIFEIKKVAWREKCHNFRKFEQIFIVPLESNLYIKSIFI